MSELLIVCIYVNDLLVTGSKFEEMDAFKQNMKAEVEMSDLGKLSYFIGIKFMETKGEIFMHQSKYTTDVLERLEMLSCNPVSTPIEIGNTLDKSEGDLMVDKTLYRKLV